MGPISTTALHQEQSSILRAAAALGMVGTARNSVAESLAVLCSDESSSETIVAVIEQQPMLAARILRVANSAYYGHARSVTTLQRAIALLGTLAVRGIAVTCSLDRVLSQKLEGRLPDARHYWRHSVATAIAARDLALVAGLRSPEESYVGGMLHNIGVAIQVCVDQPGFRALVNARRSDLTTPIRQLESQHCQIGHETCGGVALSVWQLPARIVSAATHHHAPFEAPSDEQRFVALIGIAALLATSGDCGFHLEPQTSPIPPATLECAELEDSHVAGVAARLKERVTCLLHALSPL